MFAHPATRTRRCAVALAVAGLTGTGLVAVSALPAQAAPAERVTNFSFDAQSYGSKTKNNPNADSGATALSFLGCTRVVPRSRENFTAATGDGDGVQLNNVSTRNFTQEAGSQVSVVSTVQIEDGTLAGGAVAFSNAQGKVFSANNRDGYVSRTSSSIGTLTIGGVPIDLPTDGQEQSFPVVATDGGSTGTLTVNYQVKRSNQRAALGGVNVLRYQEDGSGGTIEKVGRAFSRIDGNVEGGIFGGQAFGTKSRTGTIAQTGQSAKQPMPCPGTNGEVLETRQGRATADFGVVGEQISSAFGEQNGRNSADGFTLSRIDRVGFSGGTLVFRNIVARARVVRQADGDVNRTAKETGVGSILVNGEEQPTPAAGEEQQVAGVGSYRVKVVNKSRIGLDVTAVVVTLNNGTPADTSDDTVAELGNARLEIKRG
ncbi:MAG: hypothetical protein H0V32_01100 [Nocardioidaceae bacterium]|nr:hypothetical protein [Nocardioidaceae bacterium]MDQ3325423.1 hypothetical protein [Actinomycetota bacterium]